MKNNYQFCPHCGVELEERELSDDKRRQVCPECDWIHFLNPIPVAVCTAFNSQGQLLVIRRDIRPARGEWALPGGFMEVGETPEETCLRELAEETGFQATLISFLDIYDHDSDFYGELLIIGYAARITGGELELDDEVQAAEFVAPEAVPPIPFRSHRRLIEQALAAGYRESDVQT